MEEIRSACEHCRGDDAVSPGDGQHVQTPEKVLDVYNRGERDLDRLATSQESLVNAENYVEVLVAVSLAAFFATGFGG